MFWSPETPRSTRPRGRVSKLSLRFGESHTFPDSQTLYPLQNYGLFQTSFEKQTNQPQKRGFHTTGRVDVVLVDVVKHLQG